MEIGHIWELSVPSTQYCWDPKTALKNKTYKKNKGYKGSAPTYQTTHFPMPPEVTAAQVESHEGDSRVYPGHQVPFPL